MKDSESFPIPQTLHVGIELTNIFTPSQIVDFFTVMYRSTLESEQYQNWCGSRKGDLELFYVEVQKLVYSNSYSTK